MWTPVALTALLCCVSFGARSSVIPPAGQPPAAQGAGLAATSGAFGGTVSPAAQQSLALQAGDMGLTALAEGLREASEIKEILRDVLPAVDLSPLARELDDRGDAVQPQFVAALDVKPTPPAPRPRSEAARSPDIADAAVELDEDGRLSLRQVLHAISNAPKPADARVSGSASENDDDDDGGGYDLSAHLLQSRFLGEAMEHVIEVDSVDNSFSVFGVGQFEFQFDENHNFQLTELSSALSLDLGTGPGADKSPRQAGPSTAKTDLLAIVIGFIETPMGTALSIFGGVLLFLWSTVATALRLLR